MDANVFNIMFHIYIYIYIYIFLMFWIDNIMFHYVLISN